MGDYTIVKTNIQIGHEPFSTHFTERGAQKYADRRNEQRTFPFARYEVVRKGRWTWEVVAFQNIAVPEGLHHAT